ncbi:UDP-forming cellulose synthase catalytic subunit [Rehaibacterium terrae]|jgi:cellulose synthase (UDP-forming)|uniref:Cellulose synthase catalytic subunit [UDP-forming] n=1 Tax=Rehaibacterium terrae TaxID=1341696 RepID=A0A7W8DEH8_9GAMM|nr:UDP-forming cellulose synthase catalytic subunit [Rehaibacterium terrae]MBB5015707.1 cellulose synthase (UDP-forming) [Rehaibacterium terrae]
MRVATLQQNQHQETPVVTPSPCREILRDILHRPEMAVWVLLIFGFVWLAYQPITSNAQTILVTSFLGVLLLIMWNMKRVEQAPTALARFFLLLAIALAAFISFRYFSWRINYTISYHDIFSFVGALLLLGAELYALAIYLLGAFVNVWPIHRTPPPLPTDPAKLPTVDIIIPSYNEDPALLELTLLAATQVDYPRERLKVYLCDDGGTVQRRENPKLSKQAWQRHLELKALCERVGAIYVTREKNEHAKAGNINAALKDHCSGDLVLVLDADHIPTVDILRNTVGFFLRDPKLFLVQTPHYFINPDPLERNLRTYELMPSENEMFYNVIQHGLDFWNASFFCGSAALLRRSCLDEIGGIAGDTITEDAETAMTLHGRGYNSVYYGKPMIAGLQPETFSGFIVQRTRWAQGMVQIFLMKNPWTQPKMRITQRLAYTSSVFFWFFPFARIIFFLAPALYLLFSLKIVDAFLPADLLAYALPHVIGAIVLSNILYGHTRWPFISELYETIQSVHALPAIVNVLKSPRAPSFAVTPKGERLEEDFISRLAMPFYVMLIFNVVLLIAGVIRLHVVPEDLGIILLTMALAAVNLIYALAAIGIMLEKSQKRSAYRIPTQWVDIPATLRVGEEQLPVHVVDISHTGARLRAHKGLPLTEAVTLNVAVPAWGGITVTIPSRLVRRHDTTDGKWELGVLFQPETLADKRAIVALVYGDSDLHETNQRQRQQRIGLAEGFAFLMRTAFKHATENFRFLTRIFVRHLRVRAHRLFAPLISKKPAV